MAEHEGAVLATEVHAVSFAERPCFAVFAGFDMPHPRAVSIGLEAVFPDGPEGVAVDVSLVVFAADGSAGRDGAVDEDGSHGDTCGTLIQVVTDAPLVFVTVEEHSIYGGLGSAVAEVLSEEMPTVVKRIGVNDTFGESGPAVELLHKYKLDGEGVYQQIREFLNQE